eukprot:211639-Amphidinium_carterae.2
MLQLRRMARYLRGTVDMALEIKCTDFEPTLHVYGDAVWAGDKSRRSISSGIVCWGKVPLFSWSRFQGPRALSSGEAEYYQLASSASEALLIQQALAFYGHALKIVLYTDSIAALGISKREGVGKLRHLDLRLLWIQDGIREKLFEIRKIGTAANVADLGTKALANGVIVRHMGALGYKSVMMETTEKKASRKWSSSIAHVSAASATQSPRRAVPEALSALIDSDCCRFWQFSLRLELK